ncbi:ATP-dependent RNA helicase DBP5 [Morchella snyderi]|nr:ATP-dependent RNA helicase DBP5 [Morchella snyderi]
MSRDIHGAARPQNIDLNYDDDDDDEGLVFSLNDGDPANILPGNNSLEDDGEHDVVLKLSDLQGDPSSPLYSAKTFEQLGLSDEIMRGIHDMGFRRPSKIQEMALPLLLANPPHNMIAQSQSGTGKTAAFMLNILSRVDVGLQKPQALVLAPTRELARQIGDVLKKMGRYTNVKGQFAIPNMVDRSQMMNAHVIIGTPGTVTECIRRRILEVQNIKMFVVDEADNMLDQQNMADQCMRVKRAMPAGIQIVLWSATFPTSVVSYAERFAPNANTLSLKHAELTVAGIKQMYMDCANEADKYRVLTDLYKVLTIGSSVIFVKADRIYERMTDAGHKVAVLHSGLENSSCRDNVIDDFRSGKAKVLITTNVLARGIDVATVSMVVNYDLPTMMTNSGMVIVDTPTYLHRIGRTGRFGRVGVSISFVHNQSTWRELCEVADYFNVPMQKVPADDIDEVERIVNKFLKSGPPKKGDVMEISRHQISRPHQGPPPR